MDFQILLSILIESEFTCIEYGKGGSKMDAGTVGNTFARLVVGTFLCIFACCVNCLFALSEPVFERALFADGFQPSQTTQNDLENHMMIPWLWLKSF